MRDRSRQWVESEFYLCGAALDFRRAFSVAPGHRAIIRHFADYYRSVPLLFGLSVAASAPAFRISSSLDRRPPPSRRRAILNASTPTQALRRAAERYRELIGVE